jgi:hypothetical protein
VYYYITADVPGKHITYKLDYLAKCNMTDSNATKRVTISIKLSPDIWKQAKRAALERDVTLGQLVENAILREIRSLNMTPSGSV